MDPLPSLQSGADLLSTIHACGLCTDLPLGPNPILQWSPSARILIAGQAPGRITHQKSRPFADPSGDRLRQWLGLSSTQFYDPKRFAILPMAFCFPGTGANGDLPPPLQCAPAWRQSLLDRMDNLQLTIRLGRHAIVRHLPALSTALLRLIARNSDGHPPDHFVQPHPSPRNNRWLASNLRFAD